MSILFLNSTQVMIWGFHIIHLEDLSLKHLQLKECISLKSVITEPRRTTLMVVVDQYNKFIKFYQDGELIDEHEYKGRLMRYDKEKFIYLGPAPQMRP